MRNLCLNSKNALQKIPVHEYKNQPPSSLKLLWRITFQGISALSQNYFV